MQKKPKFFTLVFGCILLNSLSISPCCGGAEPSGKNGIELQNLENLISLTLQNLEELQGLKSSIMDFKKLQSQYLDQPQNKELLLRTGNTAKRILEQIKNLHLIHIFDAKFLSELSLFAKMVKKPSLPNN